MRAGASGVIHSPVVSCGVVHDHVPEGGVALPQLEHR